MQTITKEYAYLFHMVECARQELSRLEQMLIEAQQAALFAQLRIHHPHSCPHLYTLSTGFSTFCATLSHRYNSLCQVFFSRVFSRLFS